MTSVDVAITIPESDRIELEKLSEMLQSSDQPFESRALDGETAVTLIIALTTAALPYFKIWLNTRVAEKKNSSVSVDGTKIDGHTAEDTIRILKALDDILKSSDPEDSDD